MKRSLVVILTIAVLLFAFSGFAVADEREDAAQRLLSFGVIEGFPDGSLGLERDITRAEFARIVVLARGLGDAAEVLQGSQTNFSDVGAGLWFTGWINVASAQGIILGYPDGTFRPNANISYAEAVTMVLRTLGYNDNLPGVWPHNYLVTAADLSITAGLFTNANANAVRGNVFAMLNRAFDNYVVRWNPEQLVFQEDTTLEGHTFTLLQWMLRARESVRGIVIDNTHTDTSLRANEIVLRTTYYTTIDRERVQRSDENVFTLTGPELDINELLGLQVELFHNDSNVYFVNIRTADRDILIDIVDSDVAHNAGSIDLRARDASVNIASNARFAIFNADGEVTIRDGSTVGRAIPEGSYGRFVLDRGAIEFGWIFEAPQDFAGVVTGVNNNRVEFFVDEGNERTLNLNGFRETIVLDRHLKTTDADVIDLESVIYAWVSDDNDLFLVTVNNTQEGTLTSANRSRVTVGGVNINVNRDVTTVSDTNNEDIERYYRAGLSDVVENLDGEEVVVARDLIGEARHIVGVAAGTSGLQYGIVVSSGGSRSVDIFTQDNNIVTYNFNRSATFVAMPGAPVATALNSAQRYFAHFNQVDATEMFLFVEFRVNRHGEISEIRHLGTNSAPATNPVSSTVSQIREAGNGSLVLTGGANPGTYFITNRTVIMGVPAGTRDIDDLEVMSWNSISGLNPDPNTLALVFIPQNRDGEAAFVVFTAYFDSLVGDDNQFGIVHGAATLSGGLWRMPIDVAGEGSSTYLVSGQSGVNAVPRNSVIEFRLSSDNEVRVVPRNEGIAFANGRYWGGLTLQSYDLGNVRSAVYGDVFRITEIRGGGTIADVVNLANASDTRTLAIERNAAVRGVTTTNNTFNVGGNASLRYNDYIIFIGPYGDTISAAIVLPRDRNTWPTRLR